MKLNKTDFNVLDKLLSKIGFGSYYDLIQMLRDISYNTEPKLRYKLELETDLFVLIKLISKLSYKVKNQIKKQTKEIIKDLKEIDDASTEKEQDKILDKKIFKWIEK